MSGDIEAFQKRIQELENELSQYKEQRNVRQKIASMSAEVVDSNPYRYLNLFEIDLMKELLFYNIKFV